MRRIYLIFCIIMPVHLFAQSVSLKECIESGLSNKANIQVAKTETIIANLKSFEAKARFLPQINIAYDYRYNTIIPSQIVPIGQFGPTPSDEKRAIQFGTRWQQNAGLTIYQPLVDMVIKSRLAESKIAEKIASIELQQAEENLVFEIVQSYSKILIAQNKVEEASIDTLRSFLSYSIIQSKSDVGNQLITELNDAWVNHLNNTTNFKKAVADLVNEKIYLHFLTSIPLDKLLEHEFTAVPEVVYLSADTNLSIQADSLLDYQLLITREKLLNQQFKTASKKYIPTFGIQGFLGANQFSNSLNPVMNNSWFGNSYLGVAVKLPLFSPDQSVNEAKQLEQQINKVNFQKVDIQNEANRRLLQLKNKINQLQKEQETLQKIVLLRKQNISVYQDRLQNGQFASADINIKETDLQNTIIQLQSTKKALSLASIELLRISGRLNKAILKLLP